LKSFIEKNLIQKIITYWNVYIYRATILRFGTITFRSIIALIFWSIIGNLFQAEGVGIASSVVSILRLGAFFTMFGIQTAFIKFPLLSIKKGNIIKIFSIPIILNFIASITYLTAFDYLRILVYFSRLNWFFMTFFISAIVSFFLIFDDVLVGIKKPWFLVVKEIVTDIVLFAGVLTLIFAKSSVNSPAIMVLIWGLSQLMGILLTVLYLFLKREKQTINNQIKIVTIPISEKKSRNKESIVTNKTQFSLMKFFSFSFNNYTGTLLQTIPNLITTSIIIILFNSVDAAFIYIAWSIMGFLCSFPNSLSFVLVTQKRDTTVKTLYKRVQFSFLASTLVLIPLIFLQKQIFNLFEIIYTAEYFWSFIIILLSIYSQSIFLIYISALRLRNEKGLLQILFLIQGVIYFSLLFTLKPFIGIISVNLAWFLSSLIMAIISVYLSIKKGKKEI